MSKLFRAAQEVLRGHSGEPRSFKMKVRATIAAFAVLFSTIAPYSIAQEQTKPTDQSQTSSSTTGQTTNPTPEPKDPKVKPGSKQDVDAIGNRGMGQGKGLGNWYSLEKEIAMGKEYSQQIEASVKLVQDPVINEYVN